VKLLIRKGRVVDPVGGIGGVMDILVEDGRVAVIGSELTAPSARVIDARGLTVCAGLVDMHVHLREPGFEYKETIQTGCLAAARGGFTSIAPMPNTRPATDCPERIALVRQKAAQACGVHVWPIGAVTWGQKGQALTDAAALKKAGAVALSDDGMPVQNANLLRDALIRCRRQELTILSHCEDADMRKITPSMKAGSPGRWACRAGPPLRRSFRSCGTPCWLRRPEPPSTAATSPRPGRWRSSGSLRKKESPSPVRPVLSTSP